MVWFFFFPHGEFFMYNRRMRLAGSCFISSMCNSLFWSITFPWRTFVVRLERSVWEIHVGLSLQKYIRSSFNLPFCLGLLVRWGVSFTRSETDGSKAFNYRIMLETRRQVKLHSQECLLRRDMFCFVFWCLLLFIWMLFPGKLRCILVVYPPACEETMQGKTNHNCMKSKVRNSPAWLFCFHYLEFH